MAADVINNWYNLFRSYFFTYKDGFFDLPYLANSPELTVKSFMKMPFNKVNEEEQTISTTNPFLEGILHFQELEEGLWVFLSDMHYKANIHFNLIFDKVIPCDYHSLSYNIYDNNVHNNKGIDEISVFPNRSWSLYKPKTNVFNYHFKGCRAQHLTVFYNEKWLKTNLLTEKLVQESTINEFFDSSSQYIIWPDNSGSNELLIHTLIENIKLKGTKGVESILKVKSQVYDLMLQFAKTYKEEQIIENYTERPKKDHLKILKVEHFLVNNLFDSFVGIDYLATKFGLSPTKLKNDFKQAFGSSIFQYFQLKQMNLANDLLTKQEFRIKELADKFGYENVSKFSQAYKKHFGYLPSEKQLKPQI